MVFNCNFLAFSTLLRTNRINEYFFGIFVEDLIRFYEVNVSGVILFENIFKFTPIIVHMLSSNSFDST